jgi:hypothetical protein
VGFIAEQNFMNHMGVKINPVEKLKLVQEAECAGYGTDSFLLCVMFARLS